MSKRGNKKRFGAKHNPLGVPSAKEASMEAKMDELPGKTPAIVTKAVEKITESGTQLVMKLKIGPKLASATAEERECGCNMIASLGTEAGAIELLLSQNVIRILGPLVKDESIDVRLAALGALRNISVDGRFEVCDRMVDLDVMTPLVLLIREYGPEWTLADKSTHLNDVLIQAVNLLWNLCESSETAVKIFNQENLIGVLLPKLDPLKFGYDISLPTAYCLQTVSEENKNLVENKELVEWVTSLLDQSQEAEGLDHVLMKVLLIGLLYNITSGSLRPLTESMLGPCIQQLAKVTSQKIGPLADDLVLKLAQTSGASNGGANGVHSTSGAGLDGAAGDAGLDKDDIVDTLNEEVMEESEEMADGEDEEEEGQSTVDEKETAKHRVVELAKKRLTNVITAKQLSFELLSNLCCSDDDSEDWEEMDDCSDTEADQMDMIADQPGEETANPIGVSSDLHSLLLTNHVIGDVINACLVSEHQAVRTVCADDSEEFGSVAKQFRILQERALICLNNMAATMNADSLGGQQRVLQVWKALSQLAQSQRVKADDEFLEAVTSCIRAMAQKLAEVDAPVFQEVSEADIQFLYQLAHQSNNSNVRIHTVRTVATIGCMLAKVNPPHPMLKPIGVFLLVVCMKDSDLIVIAETLDAIFDVFAEDHLDSVAMEIGLVQKLKQFAPVFKSKINQQKTRYRDHTVVIGSAKTNLTRFIKYKNG